MIDDSMKALRAAIDCHAERFGSPDVDAFRRFMDMPAAWFDRSNAFGHFTGSAWLVNADGSQVLLTHHRKLQRWLQLGGHADGETDLALVALREAEEESGLAGLVVEPAIFDIDRHWIPERAHESGHWHFDVRHVVRASARTDFTVSAESTELAWRDIGALGAADDVDESLRRMARRWLARGC